jgi:hypothetical protein
MVRFELSIALSYDVLQPADFIFNLHPAQTPYQQVRNENLVVEPYIRAARRTDSVCGNRHLRFHADPRATASTVLSAGRR